MKVLIFLFVLFLGLNIAYSQSTDLEYYIEQAKVNSPLINSKMNDNKILQLDLEQIQTILSKPVVNLEANMLFAPIISHESDKNSFQWISEGATDYTGYDLSYSDGGQYQAFFTIKQPLFRGSQRQTFSEAAKINEDLNENQIDLTVHELEQLVNHQYILCLKAERQAEISKELLDELSRQTAIMEELVNHAIYRQTDLMLLQIEKKNYQLQYTNFSVEYVNALYDLNLLCGINNAQLVHIQDVDFEMKPDTVIHSQFLQSYTLDSLKTISQQSIYELKYKPQLNVFADAGLNAIYLPGLNRFGFSTGISFAWNIFDGNQKKLQQQKSDIRLETLEFEKRNFVTRHDLNKRKYLAQIQSVDSKLSLVDKQLVDYKTLLEMYLDEMTQAQISIMDYKNLYKDIAAKKQEKVLLQMEKQALINSYNYWNY
jgi:outer membrane protein TolC